MSVIKGSQADVKAVEWPSVQEVDSTPVGPSRPQQQSTPEPQTGPEEKPAASSGLPEGIGADSTHAYIFEHAWEAAAVLRTIVRRNESGEGPLAEMAGARLAAVFCIAIGKEIGGKVIDHLEQDEWKAITGGIVEMREVEHHACMHALEMVRRRIECGEYVELGGEQYARQLLGEIGGPGWIVQIVDEVLNPVASDLGWLAKLPAAQIAPFVSHEHPQTVALILSQLEAEQAAGILSQLPERMQVDVAYRMSTMEEISSGAVDLLAESLSRSLRSTLGSNLRPGGVQAVAHMLNNTGSSVEKNVLDQMDAQDPEVAEKVRNFMFTFEDIAVLSDGEIRLLVGQVETSQLALALRACSERLRERFKSALANDGWRDIEDLLEYAGPVRMSQVEEAQLRIVQQVRQLEEEGKLTIVRGSCDEFI